MPKIPDTARRHHVNRASPVRRPALPRARPIRNFAGVFGARPKPEPAARPEPERARRTKGQRKKQRPGMPAPAAAVARGVNAGYRVIEEYLRQGQEFARSLWPGGGGERASNKAGADGVADGPMNMTERLIRSASDLAGLFSEFLQTFSLPGTLPGPGSTPIPDFGLNRPAPAASAAATAKRAAPADTTETPTTISIDLSSRRRAEVTATARPGAWANPLQVHDLRLASKSGKTSKAATSVKSISGVTATGIPADHRIVIAIDVPDSLPAGTYSGLIVDAESNLPRGTISIQVFAPSAPRPRRARK